MAHPGGRPPSFTDPIELQNLVDEFFKNEPRPTLAGLAVHIGIARSTFYEYEKIDEFSDIIKKARQKVEALYEQRLVYESNPTGVIFALKNMTWKDRSDFTTDDKPLNFNQLTDDQLNQLINSKIGQDRAGVNAPGEGEETQGESA